MSGGCRALTTMAIGAAMALVLSGSYVCAQTMGEYGATVNSAGTATVPGGSEISNGTDSALSAQASELDSEHDPLADAPNYFTEDSDNNAGDLGTNYGPSVNTDPTPYAPTVP